MKMMGAGGAEPVENRTIIVLLLMLWLSGNSYVALIRGSGTSVAIIQGQEARRTIALMRGQVQGHAAR